MFFKKVFPKVESLRENFKDKRVLVFGLGLLGGGVATTNWLIKHGARVTVTDLKSETYLEPSLRRLAGQPKLRLNGHDKKDIEENEIIVFNPDVSINNPFVKYAQKLGKQVENEATIFYKICPRPIIAVTGTRGKTTTANWIGYFLNQAGHRAVASGNSYTEPLLKTLDSLKPFSNSQELENRNSVVNEIPSYHLEFFDKTIPPPQIAVITNLYQDHLNRHKTMRNYALAKAMIFKNQATNQQLVINYDNKWTPFFLKQKPHGQVWFFSMEPLPRNKQGVFLKNNAIYFQSRPNYGSQISIVGKVLNVGGFAEKWGQHNLINLLASSLAAHFAGLPWDKIQQKIKTMPQIPFRQETIFENKRLKIINDTSATSPDGGIAAINRFANSSTILIAGGTDRELDYRGWARTVKNKIKSENVIFLEGSATQKMTRDLGLGTSAKTFENLNECLKTALERASKYRKSVILFSPVAKSFEKFKNEFDRGCQFNKLVQRGIAKQQK